MGIKQNSFAKGKDPISDLVDVGRAIRRATGSESAAIKGIGNTQRTIESLLLFAPRFLRANMGTIITALTDFSLAGKEARRALGSVIVGSTSLTIAGSLALHGEFPNLTDPSKPC